jgi:hypothetical protein
MDLKTISMMAKLMPMELLVQQLKEDCDKFLSFPIEVRMKFERLTTKEQEAMLATVGASAFMLINKIKFLDKDVVEIDKNIDEMEAIVKVAENIVNPGQN